MKKIISFLLMSLTLTLTTPAHAKIISIAQDSGQFTLSSELHSLEIFFYNDDPIGSLGIFTPVPDRLDQGVWNDNMAAMLTRTYVPWGLKPGWGNVSLGWDYLYEWKALSFMFIWGCMDDIASTGMWVPLVDLSDYVINGFYFHNSIARNGDTYFYDFDLFADATEVPEPSTAGLFLAGIAISVGFASLRKKSGTTKIKTIERYLNHQINIH